MLWFRIFVFLKITVLILIYCLDIILWCNHKNNEKNKDQTLQSLESLHIKETRLQNEAQFMSSCRDTRFRLSNWLDSRLQGKETYELCLTHKAPLNCLKNC